MMRYLTTLVIVALLPATVAVAPAVAQVRRPASTARQPTAPPAVKSVSIASAAPRSPTAVAHGASATGGQEVVLRVELTGPAPCVERCGGKTMNGALSGYMPVTLSTSDPAHLNAQRMFVPTGETFGELAFVTVPVATQVALTVSAWSEGSAPQQARLTILPPVMTGFALEQSSAISGQPVKGVVHFSGPPASPTAVRVQLQTTDGQAVRVPATVTLEPGKTAAEFTAGTLGIAEDRNAHVVAIYQDRTLAAPLTVRAAKLVSLDRDMPCCDNPFRITLDGIPPPGGGVVYLVSEDTTRVTVPSKVTIPDDEASIVTRGTWIPGNDDDNVRVTVTYAGVSKRWTIFSPKIVKPDLIVRDIQFFDSFGNAITSAADGQPIRVCAKVRGYTGDTAPNVPIPPSMLRVSYQSPTGTGTSSGRTTDVPVTLSASGYPYLEVTHCVSMSGLTPGNRLDVRLEADVRNEVDEKSEGNNVEKASISRP